MALPRETRTKINDWVQWWNWHHDKVDSYPMDKKVEWMLKALQGAYDVMTELAREQDRNGSRERRIMIPTTWNWNKK